MVVTYDAPSRMLQVITVRFFLYVLTLRELWNVSMSPPEVQSGITRYVVSMLAPLTSSAKQHLDVFGITSGSLLTIIHYFDILN